MKPIAKIARNSFKLKRLFIALLAVSSAYLSSCQKSIYEPAIKDPRVAAAKQFFETQSLAQSNIRQETLNSYRLSSPKHPVWENAIVKQSSLGEVVSVPVNFEGRVYIKLGEKNEQVPLDSLSRLIIYKDKNKSYRSEIITKIPDAQYWDHRNNYSTPFGGLILVEDWYGAPLPSYRIEKEGQVNYLQFSSTTGLINSAFRDNKKSDSYVGVTRCYNVVLLTIVYLSSNPDDFQINEEPGVYCTTSYEYFSDFGGGLSSSDYYKLYPGGITGGGGGTSTTTTQSQLFTNAIDDSQLSPCGKKILADLKGMDTGFIGNIIQKFSNDALDWNWVVMSGDLQNNTNAQTNPTYSGTSKSITTIFDTNKFTNSTDLSFARTIMHEAVHAFLTTARRLDYPLIQQSYPEMLDSYNQPNDLNLVEHNLMILKLITNISEALKAYANKKGYSVSQAYCNDLAWGGLTHKNEFELSELFLRLVPNVSDRERILNTIVIEQTGKNISGNLTPQKGQNAGCLAVSIIE